MKNLVDKAATLQEALPYIRRFHGEMVVIKYGGNAMVSDELRDSFAKDVVLMKYVGFHPVVVHGGGPQIDETLAEFDVETERLDGLRVTDERTMKVVEMVLGARVNKEIVSLIGNHGGRAVGITGRDDHFVRAEKIELMETRSGREVDPGRVGRVTHVNPDLPRRLAIGGFIPVIAPVAVDADGRALNVNADTVAGKVAEALEARKLVLMTDIEGVKDASGEVLSSIDAERTESLIESGVISGGMIPKIRCALDAIAGGVGKAHIIDGRTRHAALLELFTDEGVGTMITR